MSDLIRKILSFGMMEAFARGFNWVLLMTLPFLLSATEYGIVGLVVAAEGLVLTVALLGQDRSLMRFFEDDSVDDGALVGSIVWILAGSAVVVFAVVTVVQVLGLSSIGGIPVVPHAWFLAILVTGSLLLRFQWAYSRVADRPGQFLASRVGVGLLKFLVVIVLALLWHNSASYPVGASVAVLLGGVLFSFRWRVVRFDGSQKVMNQLLLFGWPFVLHAVSGNLLMVADRFMLEAIIDQASVGTYTFAYAVGSSLSFVFASLVVYVEPQIYRAAGEPERATRWLNIFLAASTVGGLAVGLPLIAFGGPIAISLLAPEYGTAIEVIPIIVGAHLLTPIYLASSYRLTNQRKTTLIAVSSGVAAVVNVVLNVVLIPRYGITGAAIATFVSYLCLACIITLFSQRASPLGKTALALMAMAGVAATASSFGGHILIRYVVPLLAGVAMVAVVFVRYLKRR